MPKSGNIKLRALLKSDIKRLAELANNKKIAENLKDIFPHPYNENDAEFFINLTSQENPQVTFAIEFNGELCGVIGLVPQEDVYRKSAEIGYWIGEPFWGKGIAAAAVGLITDYGLNQLDFVRIHTGVFEGNTASMRVLEKCGYEKDGVFKKAIFKNGKILDEYRFSIIKTE
jgi:ribosomal-protein-alanine N-acetyltransferase